MTPQERYAEIEAREKAATPGEWINDGGFRMWQEKQNATEYIAEFKFGERPVDFDQREADCSFSSHARADIPYLLARVRRAEDELTRLRDIVCEQDADIIDAFLAGEKSTSDV